MTDLPAHTTNKAPLPRWDIHDLAAWLNVSPATAYRWVALKQIPHKVMGTKRTMQFDPVAVSDWWQSLEDGRS